MSAHLNLPLLAAVGACWKGEPASEPPAPPRAPSLTYLDEWVEPTAYNRTAEVLLERSSCARATLGECSASSEGDAPGERIMFSELDTLLGEAKFYVHLYYPECQHDQQYARDQDWFDERRGRWFPAPDAPPVPPADWGPPEAVGLDASLDALVAAGWLEPVEKIWIACYESCSSSARCPGGESQGNIAKLRCDQAINHLETRLGSATGGRTIAVVGIPVACDRPGLPPEDNARYQRLTLWFDMPSRLSVFGEQG